MELHFADWYLRSCAPVVTDEHALTLREAKAKAGHICSRNQGYSHPELVLQQILSIQLISSMWGLSPARAAAEQLRCDVRDICRDSNFSLIQAAEEKWWFKNCCLLAK